MPDATHISVESLLQQLGEGSEHAFNMLYKRYWREAYMNAYKRLRNVEQAEDIVQDIFASIWLKKETPIDNFSAYLYTAVRNRVIKLKKNLNDRLRSQPHPYLLHASHTLEADAEIRSTEFYKDYETCLSSLPSKRQLIFRLRFHEDLTTKTISNRLGLSRKTVQNQLGKAIEQLRIPLSQLLILLTIIKLPEWLA